MSWSFQLIIGPLGNVTEGPAWDGETLLFTDIFASRILRYDPASGIVSTFRDGTNHCNGLNFDAQGRLYGCEGDARRFVRYEPDGGVTVVADHYQGRRYNVPNDVAIEPGGRLWFTDPFYESAAGPWTETRELKELDHESIYRCDPKTDGGWEVTRVTFDTTRPNGLLFSLNYRPLYVAQSGRRADEKRELRAYPVNDDGSLGPMRVLHDFGNHRGVDGMVLDVEGNIVATAGWEHGGPGGSVYVFSPEGEVLERHPVPAKRPTNCTFAGPDLSTLYVTTTEGHLFRSETGRRGRLLYP